MVAAPLQERSAVSHAISIHNSLSVQKMMLWKDVEAYAIDGTPADCIKIALGKLCPEQPSLIMSGINLGLNTATNIFYSGTVAGALEGAIWGHQAVALSLATSVDPDYATAALIARVLGRYLLKRPLLPKTVLNVNVPNLPLQEINGIALTRQGSGKYEDVYEMIEQHADIRYVRLAGDRYLADPTGETDDQALQAKTISITPLRLNLTDESWFNGTRRVDDSEIMVEPIRLVDKTGANL